MRLKTPPGGDVFLDYFSKEARGVDFLRTRGSTLDSGSRESIDGMVTILANTLNLIEY